jgi:hypothetical protein
MTIFFILSFASTALRDLTGSGSVRIFPRYVAHASSSMAITNPQKTPRIPWISRIQIVKIREIRSVLKGR